VKVLEDSLCQRINEESKSFYAMSEKAEGIVMVLKIVRDIRHRSDNSQVNILMDEIRKNNRKEYGSMRDLMCRITVTGT
jgi:hypothetical protein